MESLPFSFPLSLRCTNISARECKVTSYRIKKLIRRRPASNVISYRIPDRARCRHDRGMTAGKAKEEASRFSYTRACLHYARSLPTWLL